MDEDYLVTDAETEERVIQFIELSPVDQSTALTLLQHFKGLRKVCPECKLGYVADYYDFAVSRQKWKKCSRCHGSGSIPVTIDEVNVRVKC